MPRQVRLRGWKIIVLGLAASFSVPLLVSAATVVWGLPEVVETGMCPAAPPDIPAYACTPGEYILRMTFGPWALIGHMMVWMAWCGIVFALGVILFAAQVLRTGLREA